MMLVIIQISASTDGAVFEFRHSGRVAEIGIVIPDLHHFRKGTVISIRYTYYRMDIILGGEFARAFYTLGTALVLWIVWRGYYKNSYSASYALLLVLAFVGYSTAFLWFNYQIGEVSEHAQTERWYTLLASIHGILSITVIVHAGIVFSLARRVFSRGENYFRLHKKMSIFLVVHWLLSLSSGFLL